LAQILEEYSKFSIINDPEDFHIRILRDAGKVFKIRGKSGKMGREFFRSPKGSAQSLGHLGSMEVPGPIYRKGYKVLLGEPPGGEK